MQTSLEVNAENTEDTVTSRDQNAAHNRNIRIIMNPLKGWNVKTRSNRTYRCNAQPSA